MPKSISKDSLNLFLISALTLFLEIACIRWFGAHVQSLTFFTNVILLGSFVGISSGCLLARSPRSLIRYSPFILGTMMLGSFLLMRADRLVKAGVSSPQYLFFGTPESGTKALVTMPIEVLSSLYFLLIALTFLGFGQEMGRHFSRQTDRLGAYSLNILGSLAGLVLLTACSWWEQSPFVWFILFGVGLAAYFRSEKALQNYTSGYTVLFLLPFLSVGGNLNLVSFHGTHEFFWSPYYRVGFSGSDGKYISVNHINHQNMVRTDELYPAYSLPHLLQRDSGGKPFEKVLIIGAGSGNDVAHALRYGATEVDAVEIDPVLQRLGKLHHSDRPYSDSRVKVHINDGRNFLSATKQKYDLIVYALLDSLVLHSGHSNVRLESYLFTKEALSQVKDHLAPNGTFVMYNYFRRGWLVSRLDSELKSLFGKAPVLFTFPNESVLYPEKLYSGFTFLIAGNTARLEDTLQKFGRYTMPKEPVANSFARNGFLDAANPEDAFHVFHRTEVLAPSEKLISPTDNWPFLYLWGPMLPDLTWKGMLLMGALSLLLLALVLKASSRYEASEDGQLDLTSLATFFFLGSGFMLLEARSVVSMALIFGGTWIVNSFVFISVLVVIFLGNLFVSYFKPGQPHGAFLGLVGSLLINWWVPASQFLGMGAIAQACCAALLNFAPLFFASLLFGIAFRDTKQPTLSLGINIAGAVLGGLCENLSLLFGFQNLLVLGFCFYLAAYLPMIKRRVTKPLNLGRVFNQRRPHDHRNPEPV
jgi:SAM-dependent methyltransferase